jgi:hypothetical protein
MSRLTLLALAVFVIPALSEEADKEKGKEKPGSAVMEKCIKACEQCAKDCTACADDLDKSEVKGHHRHAAMCRDCADTCKLAVASMKRHGHAHKIICEACARVCDMCSKMCEKLEGEVHKKAAKSAKECAAACRAMVKTPHASED